MFIKVQFYLEPCIMVVAKSDVWPKISSPFIYILWQFWYCKQCVVGLGVNGFICDNTVKHAKLCRDNFLTSCHPKILWHVQK